MPSVGAIRLVHAGRAAAFGLATHPVVIDSAQVGVPGSIRVAERIEVRLDHAEERERSLVFIGLVVLFGTVQIVEIGRAAEAAQNRHAHQGCENPTHGWTSLSNKWRQNQDAVVVRAP